MAEATGGKDFLSIDIVYLDPSVEEPLSLRSVPYVDPIASVTYLVKSTVADPKNPYPLQLR